MLRDARRCSELLRVACQRGLDQLQGTFAIGLHGRQVERRHAWEKGASCERLESCMGSYMYPSTTQNRTDIAPFSLSLNPGSTLVQPCVKSFFSTDAEPRESLCTTSTRGTCGDASPSPILPTRTAAICHRGLRAHSCHRSSKSSDLVCPCSAALSVHDAPHNHVHPCSGDD